MNKRIPLLALVFVSAVWGAHAVVGAQIMRSMSPLALTTWRFTWAALFFSPALLRATRRLWTMSRKNQFTLLASALLWAVFYPLFYYQSLTVLPPVESLLLVNVAPVIVAIVAWFSFGERLTYRQVAGLAVSLCGVAIIALHASHHGTSSWSATGEALIGTVAFALYTVLSRSLFQHLRLFDVLSLTTVVGAIVLWLISVASDQSSLVVRQWVMLPMDQWAAFAFIAAIVSSAAYILYGYGLARVPTAIASAVTFYPQAFFAAGLQWVVLGERPSEATVLGGLLLLIGIFALQWKASAK